MMKHYFKNVVVNKSQIITKFYFFILVFSTFFSTTTVNAQFGPPPLGYYDTVTACQGSTVMLLGPADLHPTDFPNMTPIGWHGPNGFTSTAANITLPNTNTVGNSSYYFDLTTEDGVFHSLEYSVAIIAGPNVTISGNTTIACGDSVTLTANGADAYVWQAGTSPSPIISTSLAQIPTASLAIGMHKLISSYNGPCLRLKRSTDGVEMDFGFLGNDLDKASVLSWLSEVANSQGLCVRLYDQSGNNGDVTYNGESFRAPVLLFNSTGRPILHFNTNQTLFNTVNYTVPYTAIYGAQQTGGVRQRVLSSRFNNWLLGYWGGSKDAAHFDAWVILPSIAADDNFYIYTGSGDGSTSQAYSNGTLLASNGDGVSGPNGIQLNGWQGISFVWWLGNYVAESSDVDFTDVLLFSSVLTTAQRNYYENAIRKYYTTGPDYTVVPLSTATYYVAGTSNTTGCSSTANVTVTVNSNPPTATYASANSTYLVDVAASIVPTITGNGNSYTISPQLPTGMSINASTGIISGIPTVLSPTTTYTITVQNNCGSTTSPLTFATICNSQLPTITASSTTICPGFGVTLTSSEPLNNLWSTEETGQSIYVTTSGNYSVTSGSSQCTRTSAPITIQNVIVSGDPTLFGTSEWIVYAYNVGMYDATTNLWTTNYSGYYTISSLDFNTLDQWDGYSGPSDALGYSGCPVGSDYHSWSAKRQGFESAFYSIDIDAHDDRAELWINNTKAWEDVGCCDSHTNVWQGYLGANDKVEFRVAEQGGYSDGAISFHMGRPPVISSSRSTTLCQGDSVTLTAPAAISYLWSTGATTQSIIVSNAANYTVQISIDGTIFSASSLPVSVVVNSLPVISVSGNTSIICGNSTILTISGTDYYMWNAANIQTPPTVVPLDQVPNAALAVGLRKLKSSYTGPCLRLRRTSDGAQSDFGFVGNDIDSNAIIAWLSVAPGNKAQCMRLYDQSGNGGDVFNYDSIYYDYFDSSPILKFDANGKPILHFNANQTLYNDHDYSPSYTAIYGANQTGGTRGRVLSSYYNNWLLGYWMGLKGQAHYDGWVNNPTTTPADDNFYIYSGASDGTSSQIYENGTLLASNAGGTSGPNGIELNGTNGGGEYSDVNFTDVMVFGSVLSATDRSSVENSIRNYYAYLSQPSITVAPTATTTYSVTGYAAATGCSTSASITVTPGSAIIAQPSAPFVCSLTGATTTVSVATNALSASYVWQSRVVTTANPNAAWTNLVANANYLGVATSTLTITKTAAAFPTGVQYRVLINTPCGQLISNAAPLTVITTVKAGSITAPASVCLGNDITFTLSKYAGTSVQWQSALSATTAFSDIPGATGPTYTIVGAMAAINKSYRAIVTSNCGATTTATTAIKTIKVDPTTVAGTISGGGVVCAGGSGTLKVAAYVGKVQWEYSIDGTNYSNAPKAAAGQLTPFSTTSTSSTAATYVVTNISENLYFRARVTSGTCLTLYSATVLFTIGTQAEVGVASAAATSAICKGTGTTLTLPSALGVITWQKKSLTATTWTAITNSNVTSISTGNLTTTTLFRASITIGSCSTVLSNEVTVAIVAAPLAKAVTLNVTRPSGATSTLALCTSFDIAKTLTIGAGSNGTIKWQRSTTSSTLNFVDIPGASQLSYTINEASVGQNWYRAVFTNSCGASVNGAAVTFWYTDCAPAKAAISEELITTSFNAVAYPNPYSATFNLSLTTASEAKVGIVVYDMTGRLLERREVRPSDMVEQQIGDQYPSGVYNVFLIQGEEVKTLRVIKR